FRRQGSFFLQVKTAKHAGFHFLITIASFRTAHHAVRIGRFETVAVAAHPSHGMRGIANNQSVVRNILGDYRTCADKRITSNGDSADDGGIRPDGASTLES